MEKGVKVEIPYSIKYTRAIDTASAAMTVSGSLTITNANPPVASTPTPTTPGSAPSGDPNTLTVTAVTVTLTSTTGTGTPTTFTPTCTGLNAPLAPGGTLSCNFVNQAYSGFLTAGQATATITFVDKSANPATSPATSPPSPNFSFEAATGRFDRALLTDKADLSPLDTLYAGFTGFSRASVWANADPVAAIPDAGLGVQDSGVMK